jgi:glutathione gamma-glutamylcysteinyltransferase
VETLYRRPLPADAVSFSSSQGQQLFAEALAAGGLGGYFALAEQYQTQSDPAFCGLGSLVVALNALAIDPGRLWKGPWRWFSEELLDCCVSLEQVRASGVDLDTLACLARCNGAEATVARPGPDDDALRAAVARASAGPGEVLIASYDRRALGQTGAGHFSPIGGYHAGRDLVLVLDVARFKYPPHWVALSRLAAAMRTTDETTGHPRGWVSLRQRHGGHGVMLSLACAGASWPEVARRLREAMTTRWPADTSLATIAASLAPLTAHCVTRSADVPDHAAAIEETLTALRATEAHRLARVAAGAGAVAATVDATAALLVVFARLHSERDIGCDAPDRSVGPGADAGADLSQTPSRLPAVGSGDGALAAELARIDREASRVPALLAELDRLTAQCEALRTTWPAASTA